MSRSFKKVPSCHIMRRYPTAKRMANRRVRRVVSNEALPNGGSYKKLYDSYDISEWHETFVSYEDFRDQAISFGRYEDEARCRQDYERWYLRK